MTSPRVLALLLAMLVVVERVYCVSFPPHMSTLAKGFARLTTGRSASRLENQALVALVIGRSITNTSAMGNGTDLPSAVWSVTKPAIRAAVFTVEWVVNAGADTETLTDAMIRFCRQDPTSYEHAKVRQ